MNRAIFQTILPIFVFSIIMLRETISYLLFTFPGEEILWYLSFTLGHTLLPLQFLMDNVVNGFFAKIAIFLILISAAILGCIKGNLLFRFLACHAALAMVAVHGIMTFLNVYSRSASLEPSLGYYMYIFEINSVMILLLLISLFYGCVQTHLSYFQRVGCTPQSQ